MAAFGALNAEQWPALQLDKRSLAELCMIIPHTERSSANPSGAGTDAFLNAATA